MSKTPTDAEYTTEQQSQTLALLLSGLSMMARDDMIRAARTIAFIGRELNGETGHVW